MLGADDPEDVAQEAFVRLYRRQDSLRDPGAALAYLRATACNLTRNRVLRMRCALSSREKPRALGFAAREEAWAAINSEPTPEGAAASGAVPGSVAVLTSGAALALGTMPTSGQPGNGGTRGSWWPALRRPSW